MSEPDDHDPPPVQAPPAEPSLADRFRRLIADTGPISVAQFMGEANARYYAARDPLGATGDFVTAPEISQMFGELVGLWLTDLWLRAGRPAHAVFVELGPGRGTLAADALRAMAQHGLTPPVHLVEGSPALRRVQQVAVPGAAFHDDLSSVPQDAPLLLVANEFLDALPVRQLVRTEAGWRERMVGLDAEGRFVFVAGSRPMNAAVPPELASGLSLEAPDSPPFPALPPLAAGALPPGRSGLDSPPEPGPPHAEATAGTVIETCPAAAAAVEEIATRLAKQGGAALIVDYGHASPRTGSTLQAVRRHRKVEVFASPGEADLTAHVDFASLAPLAQARGARWLGTVEQGAWLGAMGLRQRAAALAGRFPQRSEELASAVERLAGADQMGVLFKVMGLAAPGWPDGAGFG